jgi:hypothetical protein
VTSQLPLQTPPKPKVEESAKQKVKQPPQPLQAVAAINRLDPPTFAPFDTPDFNPFPSASSRRQLRRRNWATSFGINSA